FLKAMEFTSLTKRVADATGVNMDEVMPDPRLAAGGAGMNAKETLMAGLDPAIQEPPGNEVRRPLDPRVKPGSEGKKTASQGEMTPAALAAYRAQEAKATKCDRSRYETITDLARLDAWMA